MLRFISSFANDNNFMLGCLRTLLFKNSTKFRRKYLHIFMNQCKYMYVKDDCISGKNLNFRFLKL